MRVRSRAVLVALAALLWSGCGGDAAGSPPVTNADSTLPRAEFCDRWAEIGALQQAGDAAGAAMELARLSEQEPAEVRQPIEALNRLLDDRLAGREVDFDVMADASVAVEEYCDG